MKNILFLAVIVAITGCFGGPDSPEGLLKMYVNDVSNKKLDRDYYNKYTTGKLQSVIESMSDEDLEKYSDKSSIKNPKVKILKKSCEDSKCILTYIVSYETYTNDAKSFISEVKKLAEVLKDDGNWKIADVTNMKTYHESLEPINALEK